LSICNFEPNTIPTAHKFAGSGRAIFTRPSLSRSIKARLRANSSTSKPTPSRALVQHATAIKRLRAGVIRDSQLPPTLREARGMLL
jgi:hypothetical protein